MHTYLWGAMTRVFESPFDPHREVTQNPRGGEREAETIRGDEAPPRRRYRRVKLRRRHGHDEEKIAKSKSNFTLTTRIFGDKRSRKLPNGFSSRRVGFVRQRRESWTLHFDRWVEGPVEWPVRNALAERRSANRVEFRSWTGCNSLRAIL